MVPVPADALPRPSAGAPGRQSPLPAAAGGLGEPQNESCRAFATAGGELGCSLVAASG